ncbi:LysR family transcriptional regulator [Sphingomonas sp. Root710]|uniref:LysR family transcriptional regulator n=1 Tax=Sphingomonas sp. Root710 TaxID=1736594 RepID=UPI00138F9437|nr:LysR family transcriptional regulator [Sphingomonas sp. Root710]
MAALNALLSDRNVTRAAERLNVTQPTMSGMLQRLRYQFNDQLLIRNGREMELTPFATSLVEPVRQALFGVEQLIHAEPVFDPTTSTREFTLMASDYCTSIFLSLVVKEISEAAPGVRLSILPINAPVKRMISGELDLCITADDLSLLGNDDGGDKLHSERLFSDEFVCVVANDHPATEQTSLDELLGYPHVSVQMIGTVNTIEIASLRQRLPMFKPNFTVPDFSMVASMVAGSKLVGVIQSRLAEVAARTLPVRTFPAPFDMATLHETMFWHSRHMHDPAHTWLRGKLRTVAETWSSGTPIRYASPASPNQEKSLKPNLQAVR